MRRFLYIETMDKEQLKRVVLDQKNYFSNRNNLIDRDINYGMYIRTAQIVVISGVRRCGKSCLLSLFRQKMNLTEKQYCYLNCDDERLQLNESLLDQLYSLHLEMYGTEPVFFFDEVQAVPKWEKFVNRMYELGHKVFVTGSNAHLLSSEIATSLTGRNRVITLFPFSFKEYLRYKGHQYHLEALTTMEKSRLLADLNAYQRTGGFPLVVQEEDMEILNAWFQDILYRDVVSRYRLSQVKELRQMAIYLFSNVGKPFSYSTLQKVSELKSLSSVSDYLQYLEQSYLFFYLPKFDYSVKKQMLNSKKLYVIDAGAINRLGFHFSEEKGRLLENTVFLELLRRGKEVYYYRGEKECDFVIVENGKVVEAIQVTDKINEQDKDREVGGLKEAINTFHLENAKIIVYDRDDCLTDGVDVPLVSVWEWLIIGR